MTLQQDYRVLHEGVVMAELMPRGRIAVSGRDRASFLQGLLTNDIQALQPGTGCYAAWLTPQGRMTTDMHVLESGDMILLDVPAEETSSVLQRLDQFIFTEDVQVGDLTGQLCEVGVHGPQAATVIERTIGEVKDVSGWADYHNTRCTFADTPAVAARIDQLGVPGFVLYVGSGAESDLRGALEASGARRASTQAVTAARIEAGYPLFGIDMDEDTIPLEAGIESRAISLTKGCYVGQEVIIRVLHRGHGRVARKLVGLRVEGGEAFPEGTRIQGNGREIGFVTSSTVSPEWGSIALGYVHRDFTEPGSHVEATVEGVPRRATVSSLPFRPAA